VKVWVLDKRQIFIFDGSSGLPSLLSRFVNFCGYIFTLQQFHFEFNILISFSHSFFVSSEITCVSTFSVQITFDCSLQDLQS